MSARRTFQAALVAWLPDTLGEEMRVNGEHSRPQIEAML
jgi:hypothetical protein